MMDDFLTLAKELARESGKIMLGNFRVGVQTQNKANNTVLTEADTAINRLVIDRVQRAYPTHAVHGEEESLQADSALYVWVCDPIDGTLPFSLGVPTNVFSLALVDTKDGQPKVAVVYDPYMDRLYSAQAGKGAFLNDEAIKVSDIAKLEDAVIGNTGKTSEIVDVVELRREILTVCYRPVCFQSTVYEGALVAAGQIAAQVSPGANAYDMAAVKLLAEEAGGKATDIFGNEQRYDQKTKGLIVSNGRLHDQLVELVKPYLLK